MHLSQLAGLLLLVPVVWAQGELLAEHEHSGGTAGTQEGEEGAAASKGGAVPKGVGFKVFMSEHHLQPLDHESSPDCGIFVETNKPTPGSGMLLHVHRGADPHSLVFSEKPAHNPEGIARHEVGRVLPMKLEEVLMAARHLGPPATKEKHKAMQSLHCALWSKTLVGKLHAQRLMEKSGMQKFGEEYEKVSHVANGPFAPIGRPRS